MNWSHVVSYFFGGIFLANAIPHVAAGTMGRALQSPFAKPPGVGLSSPTVNALWGSVNLALAYLLLFGVGNADPRASTFALPLAAGFVLKAVMGARRMEQVSRSQ